VEIASVFDIGFMLGTEMVSGADPHLLQRSPHGALEERVAG
jgi:hypothetical protein